MSEREFVLYPPVGWLNRIDELLRHHGAADHDGSPLGEALGSLIRSWQHTSVDRSDSGESVEHWGPPVGSTFAPVDWPARFRTAADAARAFPNISAALRVAAGLPPHIAEAVGRAMSGETSDTEATKENGS